MRAGIFVQSGMTTVEIYVEYQPHLRNTLAYFAQYYNTVSYCFYIKGGQTPLFIKIFSMNQIGKLRCIRGHINK